MYKVSILKSSECECVPGIMEEISSTTIKSDNKYTAVVEAVYIWFSSLTDEEKAVIVADIPVALATYQIGVETL